jgi:hypothetical protein
MFLGICHDGGFIERLGLDVIAAAPIPPSRHTLLTSWPTHPDYLRLPFEIVATEGVFLDRPLKSTADHIGPIKQRSGEYTGGIRRNFAIKEPNLFQATDQQWMRDYQKYLDKTLKAIIDVSRAKSTARAYPSINRTPSRGRGSRQNHQQHRDFIPILKRRAWKGYLGGAQADHSHEECRWANGCLVGTRGEVAQKLADARRISGKPSMAG